MQDLKSTVNEFIKLVHQLKFLEAHQYYSEDIVNIENEGEPVIGLAAKSEKEEELLEYFANISAVPKNTIVCDDMSVTEWHYRFTNKQTGEKLIIPSFHYKDGRMGRSFMNDIIIKQADGSIDGLSFRWIN